MYLCKINPTASFVVKKSRTISRPCKDRVLIRRHLQTKDNKVIMKTNYSYSISQTERFRIKNSDAIPPSVTINNSK